MKSETIDYQLEDSQLRIRDIYLASAILSLSAATLTRLDLDEFPIAHFVLNFPDKRTLDQFVRNYWGGNVSVEPKQFIQEMKTLKARIANGHV